MSTEQEIAAVSDILRGIANPTIIDLGAYCGEDSEMMRYACKQTHEMNVMVEPDSRNVDVIRQQRRGLKTVIVQAAIASYTGMIDFHFASDETTEGRRSGSGSIKLPTVHEKEFPRIRFGQAIPVPCWSLDHLTYSLGIFGEIDFLWVDIQGAERDMIAGGQSALARTRYLFIEAETTALYEGMALKDELLGLLPGFRVVKEFEYNLLMEAK
jgi:FkbM family methyltransferase